MANIKEVDLFEPTKKWLEDRGYTVYPEVEYKRGRADIVAINGGMTAVVELKTSLSIELIAQAVYWRDKANMSYVCVPMPQKDFHDYAITLLKREGIGLLYVDFNSYRVECKEHRYVEPTVDTTIIKGIRGVLSDLHLELGLQGGQSGGGYLTGYKATVMGVKKYLETQGKYVTIDDILKNCKTHYSNPKQSLGKALREFETEWCESEVIGRKLHFRIRGTKK